MQTTDYVRSLWNFIHMLSKIRIVNTLILIYGIKSQGYPLYLLARNTRFYAPAWMVRRSIYYICTNKCNWIVCPSFCSFISPFVNYSLSRTYKVQYLDLRWPQSIQSKVQCKFIDGLLTRQWHHMPIGVWEGSKYMYRAWIFCKILTLLPSGAFVFHELILLYNHSQISHWLRVTVSKFKVILTIYL